MKLPTIFFAPAVLVVLISSCDKAPTTAAADNLYLHWFTIGSEQEFVPLHSSEVHLGEEIVSEGLKGKVLRDSGGLHATLEGRYGLSVGNLRNYIELDEIFGPAVYSYSGVINTTYFVLTLSPDSRPFYNQLKKRKPIETGDADSFEIDLNIPLFVDPVSEAFTRVPE